jgi:hypothetical protein
MQHRGDDGFQRGVTALQGRLTNKGSRGFGTCHDAPVSLRLCVCVCMRANLRAVRACVRALANGHRALKVNGSSDSELESEALCCSVAGTLLLCWVTE